MSSPDAETAERPTAGSLLRQWPAIIAGTAMWIMLWGDVSVGNALVGLVATAVVLAVARDVAPLPFEHINPLPAARYALTFLRLLVEASVNVVLAVLQPSRIHPGIIAMPLRDCSDAVVTLIANSITLTPGTLTLETERRDDDTAVLYVHALDLSDPESVRADIALLEQRAVDAFAGADARPIPARSLDDHGDGGAAHQDGDGARQDGDGARQDGDGARQDRGVVRQDRGAAHQPDDEEWR